MIWMSGGNSKSVNCCELWNVLIVERNRFRYLIFITSSIFSGLPVASVVSLVMSWSVPIV